MDRSLEQKITKEIKNHFGSELVSIVLFGSQARGTADEHSDIDLLVIAEGVPSDWRQQRDIVNKIIMSPELRVCPEINSLIFVSQVLYHVMCKTNPY